jgi:hypothetical protein
VPQSDFEAAIALLGALTTSMCAVTPLPETLGLAREPAAEDQPVAMPGAPQPDPPAGDQRILPIGTDSPPPGPPVEGPIADIAPPPLPTVPPLPAQPSPIGDAQVPVTPVPAPIAPPTLAAALPIDRPQPNDVPLDLAGAGDLSASATGVAHQPEIAGTDTPAANSAARSQEAVHSTDLSAIDVATHPDHRSSDRRREGEAFAVDVATGGGTEAIAMAQAGNIDRPAGDSMVKVERSLAQLPSVVSDLAQQSRTESSPRRVVIPLDPPALGHVTVEIIVRADSVKVSLQHGDESTFNALNAQRPAIEAALESNGLHLSGFDVSGNNRQRASHMRTTARHFEALVEQIEPDGALRL